jgi:hypothetical protein
MPVFYALVARRSTVLAEQTVRSGNFPTITRALLGKITDSDQKVRGATGAAAGRGGATREAPGCGRAALLCAQVARCAYSRGALLRSLTSSTFPARSGPVWHERPSRRERRRQRRGFGAGEAGGGNGGGGSGGGSSGGGSNGRQPAVGGWLANGNLVGRLRSNSVHAEVVAPRILWRALSYASAHDGNSSGGGIQRAGGGGQVARQLFSELAVVRALGAAFWCCCHRCLASPVPMAGAAR